MPTPSHRRRLVPRSAIIAGIVIVALIAGAIAASIAWSNSRAVVIPDVQGLPLDIAERALQVVNLSAEVAGTRVSTDVPEGAVISQDPLPGTESRRGDVVRLILSAGPQTFPLPDVIGMDVDEARDELVRRGLVVNVVGISAETTESIVLEMFPSPGTSVNTGDAVRLSVPGASGDTDMLLPYDLSGVSVVLDPAPAEASDATDPALDVARRLSALLQAAGATVSVTRSTTETAPPVDDRLDRIAAAGPTVVVGIDVGRTGEPGLRVLHVGPAGGDAAASTRSRELAAAITRASRVPGLAVLEPRPATDPITEGTTALTARVIAGDIAADADRVRMADPGWADIVARAIYRGLGTFLAAE